MVRTVNTGRIPMIARTFYKNFSNLALLAVVPAEEAAREDGQRLEGGQDKNR